MCVYVQRIEYSSIFFVNKISNLKFELNEKNFVQNVNKQKKNG